MPRQAKKRVFRIDENVRDPSTLALHRDTDDEVIAVHPSPRWLADFAFESGADEVTHDGKYLAKREGSR